MRNRSNLKVEKSAVATACRHYWIIETASGPTSRGVCKICGEEREFQNSWSDANYKGKDARVFNLPNMLDEEEGKEQDS